MTERQTVAGAFAKIETHEQVCAVRWQGVNFKLNLIFLFMLAAISMALGVGSWALDKMSSNQAQQLAQLQQVTSELRALPKN